MTNLPAYDQLPKFHKFNGCAWEVWGKGDQLGTVNLLTDEVVKQAAQEEIRSGKTICLNWPLNFPAAPVFGRKPPEITILAKSGLDLPLRDDVLHINTQHGSQWDGLRHFGVLEHKVYYGGVPATEIESGEILPSDGDSLSLNSDKIKLGMHNWAQHGICGRGVLLDVLSYYKKTGSTVPYDPLSTYSITVAQLQDIAAFEGVEFRKGDILILRVGFMDKYYKMGKEARDALPLKKETFAGIEQSEDMKRFLWDNHFAAVASDQPSMEAWPPAEGVNYLHETLLGLWGMPIGEFFDLEALSKHCSSTGRYTFFFSSWPLNVLGGVASPPNAAAYF